MILTNKWSLRFSNAVGILKLATLLFISITGLVVLGGKTKITNPTANFHNAFESSGTDGNGLANALVKITFAYSGYQNAFNVANEIKNPIQTIRRSAPLSLLIMSILYIFVNIAYFAASEFPSPHTCTVGMAG